MGIAFLALGSCILFSLKKGWGSKTVLGFFFLVRVLGNLCAKTARNAARFSLFVFSG